MGYHTVFESTKPFFIYGFNTLDPTEGLKIPNQYQQFLDQKQNKSYLTTAIGLAFRKLDVFGYYKFVTAVKNINLLPDRSSMMKQKKLSKFSLLNIQKKVVYLQPILKK